MVQTLIESKKAKGALSTIALLGGFITAKFLDAEFGAGCITIIICVYVIWQGKVDKSLIRPSKKNGDKEK